MLGMQKKMFFLKVYTLKINSICILQVNLQVSKGLYFFVTVKNKNAF